MSNPEQTLARFRDVIVNNNSRQTLEISIAMRRLSQDDQRAALGGEYASGFMYLYRNDAVAPSVVMETVVSPVGDAITSLYMNHSIFADHASLVRARRDLIAALSEKVGLSAHSIGIDDPGRGRSLGLSELATGQLIDLLAERMGASIVTTGTHGGDIDLTKGALA
jgi:hypothetical protein